MAASQVIDTNEVEEDSAEYIEHLNALWKAREYSEDFKNLLEKHLFITRFVKIGSLDRISRNLKNLDIEVTEIGSDLSADMGKFKTNEFDLILIDYYLGAVENETAVETAVKNIRLIHSQYPDGKKPATLLMSSLSNVEARAAEFFEKGKVMEGISRFSAKQDLEDSDLIKLIVGILNKEFKSRDQLEKYGEAITQAANQALIEFKESVSKLSVEDFIFIQHTVLQADKQPLGEYLAWLFSSYWGHLLFKDPNFQSQSDAISFFYVQEQPIVHRQPSVILSDMYMSALFETFTNDISEHPFFEHDHLHLGDLLVSDYHKEVWMVINPECDLARIPIDRSVFLLPGRLIPIGQEPPSGEEEFARTEFFKYKNEPHKIVLASKGDCQ